MSGQRLPVIALNWEPPRTNDSPTYDSKLASPKLNRVTSHGSAALRPRPIITVVHAGVVEFGLAHHTIARMRRAHVRQVALVIGHAQNRPDCGGGGGQKRAYQVHHLVEVLFGRYRSNSS